MIPSSPLAAVILAAGKGTRMKSARAKVLHEVFFQPMVHHVINAVQPLQPERTVLIVGHQLEAVKQAVSGYNVAFAEQREQNGTGHAVLCTESLLADFSGTVLILYGDAPLLLTDHLKQMVQAHEESGSDLTIMTTSLEDPTNYGRIVCDRSGNVAEIVEEKDATPEQRRIKEVNAGIYCVDSSFLFKALKRITTDNSQQEMYLTDIVAIGVSDGIRIGRYEHPHPAHALGVNSRVELAQAHGEILARRNRELMSSGITMHIPPTITVGPQATVAEDTTLEAGVSILGDSTIGRACHIESGAFIRDARLGDGVQVGAHSVLYDCTIPAGQIIPPLTRIGGDD